MPAHPGAWIPSSHQTALIPERPAPHRLIGRTARRSSVLRSVVGRTLRTKSEKAGGSLQRRGRHGVPCPTLVPTVVFLFRALVAVGTPRFPGLKKNATPASSPCPLTSSTHARFPGPAFGADSLPTMTQEIPVRSIVPRSSSRGSVSRSRVPFLSTSARLSIG